MLTIYGASDDLIEVEGDIREEFNVLGDDKGDLLAFSDGTIVRVTYTHAGIWRIEPVARGAAALTIETCAEDSDDGYSDRATLEGDVRWVVLATGYALKR